MRILIYDEERNVMENYDRNLCDDMPYTTDGVLTLDKFRQRSQTQTMWSTKRFLQGFDTLNHTLGHNLPVTHAFRRAHELTEDGFLHHLLGTAVDNGDNCGDDHMLMIAKTSEALEVFDGVSELDHNPLKVHVHTMDDNPSSDLVPFKQVKMGSRGVEVCVLQDSLWALDYSLKEITGIFDRPLQRQLRKFQADQQLTVDGICGQQTWERLMQIHQNLILEGMD